jgi:lipopolysaccharide/colanic/teichoic acid biosynthesis glycosyltransferase
MPEPLAPPLVSRVSPDCLSWRAKRSLDVVASLALLVAIAPLLAFIALAIKLDSPGPVLFRQKRRGQGPRTFWMLKFRTMVADAETRLDEVAHLNVHANRWGDVHFFKAAGDPRITRMGALLRRVSLDEIPQLVNVLRGEMSLVGPRPLVLEEDSCVTPRGRLRSTVRPGITGLWQVLGRNEIPFDRMLELDTYYVEHWSLRLDIQLLLRTIPAVLAQRQEAY